MLRAIPMLTVVYGQRWTVEKGLTIQTLTACDPPDLRSNRLCKVLSWVTSIVHAIGMLIELGTDAGDAACHVDQSLIYGDGLEIISVCHKYRVELQRELFVSLIKDV